MKSPLKVLIVDDEAPNRRILEHILMGRFDSRSAINGEEALAVAAVFSPDVVLLDIMMPGISGYEVCRRLKDEGGARAPKVILVSGKARIEERLEGYKAGADDYITKPFDDEELLAKLEVTTRTVQTEDELRQSKSELEDKVRLRSEQLQASERMAFLGMQTAEIIHDLKTPLTVISAATEEDNPVPLEKKMQFIRRGGDRISELLSGILQAVKGGSESASDLDLNEVLRSELKLIKHLRFAREVEFDMELGEIPALHGVPRHFHQSLGNLIKNACESMYDSQTKRLTVRTSAANGRIEIAIADTGCGIPGDKLDRIFDPFFTTKPSQAKNGEPTGTGLGLASVLRTVENYGGSIQVESQQGRGSCFVVTFPLSRADAEKAA